MLVSVFPILRVTTYARVIVATINKHGFTRTLGEVVAVHGFDYV
jgi:hypothetical protein